MRSHPLSSLRQSWKVFSAVLIKWAETSSDLEQNSTICRTIHNRQNNDCLRPTYTFCFFKAVRPVGWGTRLKLRHWLLRFHFLVVLRWSGWAGNAKGGNHTISLTDSLNLQSVLWSYVQYQTDWLQTLHGMLFFLFVCQGKTGAI